MSPPPLAPNTLTHTNIVLTIEPRMVYTFRHIVQSLSHTSFWCLFIDPHLTTTPHTTQYMCVFKMSNWIRHAYLTSFRVFVSLWCTLRYGSGSIVGTKVHKEFWLLGQIKNCLIRVAIVESWRLWIQVSKEVWDAKLLRDPSEDYFSH